MSTKGIAQRRSVAFFPAFLLAAVFAAGLVAHAQTDGPAWLRYAPLQMPAKFPYPSALSRPISLSNQPCRNSRAASPDYRATKSRPPRAAKSSSARSMKCTQHFPAFKSPCTSRPTASGLRKRPGKVGEPIRSSSSPARTSTARSLAHSTCCAGSQRALTSRISMRSKLPPCPSAGSTSGTTPAAQSSAATAAGRSSLRAERSATI